MLALLNASITETTASALGRERDWELRRVASVREALEELSSGDRAEVVAIIVEAEPVGAELLDALPDLELVACLRSDPVNVDIAAASERDVAVVNTPGRNAEAVADFTLGLCLAAIRNIAITHHKIVARELTSPDRPTGRHRAAGDVIWRPDDPAAPIPYLVYRGHHLSALTLGVIGFGIMGRAVARRFGPLAREVVVFDPAVGAEQITKAGCIAAPLEELLARSDVVSLHARSKTIVVGPAELAAMKPGSYLINTARASVLDYEALADALVSGHLAGAALDVFPDEPLESSSRLLDLPGLTLTPHLAGAAVEVADRQSEILLDAVRGLYAPAADWSDIPVCNSDIRPRWQQARVDGTEQTTKDVGQ